MSNFRPTFVLGTVAAILIGSALAQDEGFKLEPMHAFSAWEVGKVEQYQPDAAGGQVAGKYKQLIDHAAVWLLEEAHLSSNAKVFLGVGGAYFFILPSPGNQYSFGQRSGFGLTDAHGEFEFWKQGEGDRDHGLRLKLGVFPFKYNSDAKNLGEYMFRTYTYPTVIFTGGLTLINSAMAQLNGLDANTKIGGFENDVMLTVKTDQIPTAALSLTDIVSYSFKNVLTLGAGLMYDNFYDPTGLEKGDYAGGHAVGEGAYFTMKDGSIAYPSNTPPDPTLIADTSYYTFTGEKAMARAALDFGKLLPENSLLSPGDLRVYGEAILMGIKNYPGYFNKMSNRFAYMAGINLPTFRLIDVLSFEYEYCKNPYKNSQGVPARSLVPTPEPSGEITNGDNLKWTLYAKKDIYRSFSISAQAASDHLRLVDYFGHTNDEDVMQHKNDWYWAVQLGYSI